MINKNSITILAKVTFIIYLYVIFFGVGQHFGTNTKHIEEISTSNKNAQIIFILLFILSSICLIGKGQALFQLIKEEKFLTLFLIFCLISLLWSNYPFTSFKRWFQFLVSLMTICAFLLNIRKSSDYINLFKIILILYVLSNYISILFIPGAIDAYHNWQGIAVSKNFLGQGAIICIICFANIIKSDSLNEKYIFSFFLILSVILLLGSKSMTSILTLFILLYLLLLSKLNTIFKSLQIGNLYTMSFHIFTVSSLLAVYIGAQEIIVTFFDNLGKDLTFTGRVNLWIDMINLTIRKIPFGYGYGGFWVINRSNSDLFWLFEKYPWLPNEAHSGYIDIFVQVGIFGILLFIILLASYIFKSMKYKPNSFVKWSIISILIMNLQESTLFSPRLLTGEIFYFSYILFHFNLLKQQDRLSNL